MGKRLFRIFQKDISSRLTSLTGIELNLIMKNNSTFHGIINDVKDNQINFKDLRNQKHLLRVEDIIEIVYDKESAY
jgi:hypothetical protein